MLVWGGRGEVYWVVGGGMWCKTHYNNLHNTTATATSPRTNKVLLSGFEDV